MAAPKGNQYAKGNTHHFGRPKIYTEEMLDNEGLEFIDWVDRNTDKILWIKDFAKERGYSPCNYSEFSKRSKIFFNALKYAKDKQEKQYFEAAASKEVDMAFVKFFMPRTLRDRDEWYESFGQKTSNQNTLSLEDLANLAIVSGTSKEIVGDKSCELSQTHLSD